MCDTGYKKCSGNNCKERLPFHLVDFDTDKKEIKVFCEKHLPNKNVRIFLITKMYEYEWNDDWTKETKTRNELMGKKMGMRYLTRNAIRHKEGNYPNAEDFEIIEDR